MGMVLLRRVDIVQCSMCLKLDRAGLMCWEDGNLGSREKCTPLTAAGFIYICISECA